MSTTMILLMAFGPAVIIALYFYMRDLNEPEPYGLLLLSMIFGGLAFFISRGLGLLLHQFLFRGMDDVAPEWIEAFLLTGLLAELFKFIFLRGVVFYSKNFNQPFDGIVYAIMVGMGYVIAFNSLQVFIGDETSSALPMVTAAPAHAVFAVIMGFFTGEAKVFHSRNILYSLLALLLAAFAHGYYDYFLALANIKGLWIQAAVSLVIVLVLSQMAISYRKSHPKSVDPNTF